MSSLQFYILLFLFLSFINYELYQLEVNEKEFAISQRLEVDASARIFFDFITQTHIMEKLLPWLTRLKEADMRTLMVGKFYHAHSKVIFGTEDIHLIVAEYRQGSYLTLESDDQLIKQRIEIRTKRYHNQTILTVKVYSKRTSAIFQEEKVEIAIILVIPPTYRQQ